MSDKFDSFKQLRAARAAKVCNDLLMEVGPNPVNPVLLLGAESGVSDVSDERQARRKLDIVAKEPGASFASLAAEVDAQISALESVREAAGPERQSLISGFLRQDRGMEASPGAACLGYYFPVRPLLPDPGKSVWTERLSLRLS